uniref:Uncharacterized protein n=1 Tax=Cucumis melo TaxID=3656 RepID=A0A9I9EIN5_CUCME
MNNVGANSDIHLVLFDEENRAIGFHSKLGECTGGVRIFIWYGWKFYSIYYNFHEEIGQVKEVVCARFWKWFYFEGYLSLCTGNQIYMSSGGPHYDKDDGSAGRTPLHRSACKRCCTGCTLHNVSLGLLVKSSRQIQVQKSVVRRLHAIFRSKVAGSPGGGVTSKELAYLKASSVFEIFLLKRYK